MQLKTCLIISSVIFFSGCAGIPRPDSDLCVINAPASHLICYNLKRDYTDNGVLKPDAKPHYKSVATLNDVNKHIIMDVDSFTKLKAYIKKVKAACE